VNYIYLKDKLFHYNNLSVVRKLLISAINTTSEKIKNNSYYSGIFNQCLQGARIEPVEI
jgi:hypothetical protein